LLCWCDALRARPLPVADLDGGVDHQSNEIIDQPLIIHAVSDGGLR
jgi:hypothetical protein